MHFLNKMERKFGRFAIQGLMKYIILFYVAGYLIEFLAPQAYSFLTLEPYLIFHYGQVWRLVSWVLIPPPTGNFFFAIIMIILYYQLGTALERTWGAFKFNVYIFGGMIFTVLGALLLYVIYGVNTPISMGGSFSTYYINMTIFLAFAMCYPDMRIMLYFIIPIKMKWMAIVYAALVVYDIVRYFMGGAWFMALPIIASLLNFIIFFLGTRNLNRYNPKEIHRRNQFKRAMGESKTVPFPGGSKSGEVTKHKCAVCGRTEKDDPNLEFRFCSKCNGNYEYCQDHLYTHIHKK